jgi:hypothetical protein
VFKQGSIPSPSPLELNMYHRVIVRSYHKQDAIDWCNIHNIAVEHCGFNDDYFDTNLNTYQFIFNEKSCSDLTCAKAFANEFATNSGEVRSYNNVG